MFLMLSRRTQYSKNTQKDVVKSMSEFEWGKGYGHVRDDRDHSLTIAIDPLLSAIQQGIVNSKMKL